MDVKEILEFLELLRKFDKDEQKEIYYMLKGAIICSGLEEKVKV